MLKAITHSQADIGDYLKLGACTAVMAQSLIGLVLTTQPTTQVQIGLGILYNLVKFTAPAFIFGILYTTMRVTLPQSQLTYGHYLRQQWHALFIPTIWWTLIYLVLLPNLQQRQAYHNLFGFLWQFINGNAAPHLWYNTMMLQFIVLMPLFWYLATWCQQSWQRGMSLLLATVLFASGWLWFYDQQVFYGPHMQDWYLFDRLFVSFLLYAVLGVLAWQYRYFVNHYLPRIWWAFIGLFGLSFYWINRELLVFGQPLKLVNAPYYKPSMTIYALAVIGLLTIVALFQIKQHLPITTWVHRFAQFAYKAYLANVFWAQLLWVSFGRALTIQHPWLGLGVCYLLTWLLAFASAFSLHGLWQKIKNHFATFS